MSGVDFETFTRIIEQISRTEHGPEAERRVAELLADGALWCTGFDKALVLTGGTEQRMTVACNRGVDERYSRFVVEHYVQLPGMKALEGGEPLSVTDAATAPEYESVAELACSAKIRALAVFPLLALDGELVGALVVYDSEPATLEPERMAAVQALAAHGSLALGNERLLRAREYLLQQTLLEKSQEIVSALASGIAHEFNNLLGDMLGMVALAPSLDRRELKRLCEQLEAHVDRASRVSRNLLDLARTSQPQDDVENTDLAVAVQDAVEMIRLTAHDECEFDIRGEPGPIVARISPMAFSRVILNLLLNAVQELGWVGGGKVTVRLSRVEHSCVIEVDDDGPGVPPDREDLLFDPLVGGGQGDGSGVGLAAARGIVERAGGTLALKHRDGPGACFQIHLPSPASTPTGPHRPLRETLDPDESPRRGVRLLLAEDEPVQRLAFAEALRAEGYEVDEAADGAEALIAVEQQDYSALLLDHAMPHVTGANLLTTLRAEGSEVPVILVTGFGRDPQLTALASDPYTSVVSKPVRVHTLIQMIEELIP
jgi:signal transduction histidine kinase